MRTICLLSLIVMLVPATSIAQPPPPPPPGMPDYHTLLQNSYNERRLDAYGDLFAVAVHVYAEGKLVAESRSELLARIKAEFDRNLHLSLLSWAQGNQLLIMEEVMGCIPANPSPNVVYHGCPGARAVRYDLGNDGKIIAVHILDAERAWNMHPTAPQADR